MIISDMEMHKRNVKSAGWRWNLQTGSRICFVPFSGLHGYDLGRQEFTVLETVCRCNAGPYCRDVGCPGHLSFTTKDGGNYNHWCAGLFVRGSNHTKLAHNILPPPKTLIVLPKRRKE